MIAFEATFFDGRTSRGLSVKAVSDGFFLELTGTDEPFRLHLPLRDCSITPPIGKNSYRTMMLPGGGKLQTKDGEAIAALEELTGRNQGFRFVHALESHWKTAFICLGILAVIAFGFFRYGLPLLAKQAAKAIPSEVVEKMSKDSLSFLDRTIFAPSVLTVGEASRIKGLMNRVSFETMPGPTPTVQFRKGVSVGPNAFALPSGEIVITDELARLVKNDRELSAILVHELAHLRERHAIRQILQTTGVFLVISVLAGDVTSITSAASALPTLLVESGYSREFEREADRAAALYIIRNGWGTKPYQDILERLARSQGPAPRFSLFSTHPALEERLRHIREIEADKGGNSDSGN
jgi:Zn-dependent protease with chaperone function